VQLNVRSASATGRDERESGSIYSFRYQDEDRERSVKVTQVVVDNFVEETLGGRRAGAEGAQKFVESELKELEQRLRQAEDRRAESTWASCRPSRAATSCNCRTRSMPSPRSRTT
jgi:hypothetical protein